MPFDPYASFNTFDCSGNALAIMPDDDNDLPFVPTYIWCGVGGDLRMTMLSGEIVTFKNNDTCSRGFPLRVTRIHATGTTATDLVIGW